MAFFVSDILQAHLVHSPVTPGLQIEADPGNEHLQFSRLRHDLRGAVLLWRRRDSGIIHQWPFCIPGCCCIVQWHLRVTPRMFGWSFFWKWSFCLHRMPFSPSPSNALEWVAIFLESNLSFPGYPAIFRTFPDPLMVSSLDNPWFFQQIRPLVGRPRLWLCRALRLGTDLEQIQSLHRRCAARFWVLALLVHGFKESKWHEDTWTFFPELIIYNMTHNWHTHTYIYILYMYMYMYNYCIYI